MCKPGDTIEDIGLEAREMGESKGAETERRASQPEKLDMSRWIRDTLRLWPILLFLFLGAIVVHDNRSKIDDIQADFIDAGPRVSTEGGHPTTVESKLRDFRISLGDTYTTREVSALEKKLFDFKLDQIAKDVTETKEMVKSLQEAAR